MSSIGYKSGLIVDDDVLSLSPGVIYKGQYLYDRANGARHHLSSTASFIIKYIVKPTSWRDVQLAIRKRYLTTETIRIVLNFLDDIGGLVVVKSLRGRLAAFNYRCLMLIHGIVLNQPSHRYSGDIRGGIRAVSRAMMGLYPLIIAACTIGYGLNIPLSVLLIGPVLFSFGLFVSVIIHEYAHLHFALIDSVKQGQSMKPYFLQRGLRLGLLYSYSDYKAEFRSAIYGPAAGGVGFDGLYSCRLILDELDSLGCGAQRSLVSFTKLATDVRRRESSFLSIK